MKKGFHCFIFILGTVFICSSCGNKPTRSHQEVKSYAAFHELPLTAIEPQGWLLTFLENQRDGLTGHLEAAGNPFNTEGWSAAYITENQAGSTWWPYEQTAYWIDGMLRCGYLLRDDFLIRKARRHTDYTLQHPDSTGFLGSEDVKVSRWPHAVFFRALMAQHSATRDTAVIQTLKRHFLQNPYNHGKRREHINIESILYVYAANQDSRLLALAESIYQPLDSLGQLGQGIIADFITDKPTREHGVTYNEYAKLGAMLYMFTGKKHYLDHSIKAYDKLFKYHDMADGMHICAERMSPTSVLEGHEACNLADNTWSLGYLLMATGCSDYADRIEKVCFNALPGQITPDFKALQYFSSVNQTVAAHNTNHCGYHMGGPQMSYAPAPWERVDCCPGNINRVMPNYVARMWMEDSRDGLVAVLYGPSKVTFPVGKSRTEVTITESTNYPFSESIEFVINTKKAVKFPFTFRIPGWCADPKVLINGRPAQISLQTGHYNTIQRSFKNGDQISLLLPPHIKLTSWPDKGITVERGPLVYALGIKIKQAINPYANDCTENFPAYNIYPRSDWNYALCMNHDTQNRVEVIQNRMPENPWTQDNPPVILRVPARKIKGYGRLIQTNRTNGRLVHSKGGYVSEEINGNFVFTPPLPDPEKIASQISDTIETISLIPYGCTRLRITVFPQCAQTE